MTAQGEDVLAWLEAAIALREEAARDAARSYGPRWVRPVDTDLVRVSEDDIWFQALSQEIAEHVVYNDPKSVLRRCATDRSILGWCKEVIGDTDLRSYGQPGLLRDHPEALAVTLATETIISLAEGYGWTGGER